MVVVLWISRHNPLKSQILYLKQRLGDFQLVQHKEPVPTADRVVDLVKKHGAKYVMPVLPLSFIMRLVEVSKRENFTVLRAEMENIHNCSEQPCQEFNEETDTIMESRDFQSGEKIYRHFRFKGFKVLKDIVFIEEDF